MDWISWGSGRMAFLSRMTWLAPSPKLTPISWSPTAATGSLIDGLVVLWATEKVRMSSFMSEFFSQLWPFAFPFLFCATWKHGDMLALTMTPSKSTTPGTSRALDAFTKNWSFRRIPGVCYWDRRAFWTSTLPQRAPRSMKKSKREQRNCGDGVFGTRRGFGMENKRQQAAEYNGNAGLYNECVMECETNVA